MAWPVHDQSLNCSITILIIATAILISIKLILISLGLKCRMPPNW